MSCQDGKTRSLSAREEEDKKGVIRRFRRNFDDVGVVDNSRCV